MHLTITRYCQYLIERLQDNMSTERRLDRVYVEDPVQASVDYHLFADRLSVI